MPSNVRRVSQWGWVGRGWEFYIHWTCWSFSKTHRMNGTLYWGWNPYVSYRLGPFDLRIFKYAK